MTRTTVLVAMGAAAILAAASLATGAPAQAQTITLNGAQSHGFDVARAGTVTATITAIDPSGSFLGFQLGTWSGVVCTAVLSNEAGTLSSVLSASTQSAASLCVKMHDPNGILTDKTVNYTVSVTHP